VIRVTVIFVRLFKHTIVLAIHFRAEQSIFVSHAQLASANRRQTPIFPRPTHDAE
jgi:hypothetical protein